MKIVIKLSNLTELEEVLDKLKEIKKNHPEIANAAIEVII